MIKLSNKKYLIIKFILAISIFILIIINVPKFQDTDCNYKSIFKEYIINGIVYDKYIDSKEHSYPIIIIKNEDSKIIELNFVSENSGLYDQLKIGDSIFKLKGELLFNIKNNARIYNKLAVFNCSND